MSDTQSNNKNHPDRAPTDVGIDNLPTIQISDWMYRLAEAIAEARAITYEPVDGGTVYGDQDSYQAQLTGVLGELSLQQTADCVQQPIYLYNDPGYDLFIDDYKVDVKTTATHIQYPDLLIPYDQNLVADRFFLIHRIARRRMRIIGWAPRHRIANRDPERYPGDSLNYVLRPHELFAPTSSVDLDQ